MLNVAVGTFERVKTEKARSVPAPGLPFVSDDEIAS